MTSLRRISLAVGFVLLVSLVLPVVAQRRGPRGRIWTKAEVNQLIKNAENRSDVFVKLLDKALDNSVLDGTRREDRLNERAKIWKKPSTSCDQSLIAKRTIRKRKRKCVKF